MCKILSSTLRGTRRRRGTSEKHIWNRIKSPKKNKTPEKEHHIEPDYLLTARKHFHITHITASVFHLKRWFACILYYYINRNPRIIITLYNYRRGLDWQTTSQHGVLRTEKKTWDCHSTMNWIDVAEWQRQTTVQFENCVYTLQNR